MRTPSNRRTALTVTGLVATAAFSLAGCASGTPAPVTTTIIEQPPAATASNSGSTDVSQPATQSTTGQTYPETVGSATGATNVYSLSGGATSASSIPNGRTVRVAKCVANNTGIPSVNVMYVITGPAPWTNVEASANTFLNGDAPHTKGTHDVDDAVPNCTQLQAQVGQ